MSDGDDDGDGNDVITCWLQHSLKIRNYASASSSPIATHNYNNNDDNVSSSSNHSTVGDSSGGGSNNYYEDNDDDAEDANHEDNDNDANNANDAHNCFSNFASTDESPSYVQSSICDGTHCEEDYSNDEDNDYSFTYASSSPCATRSNICNAVGSASNAVNDSNNHNAVGGSDDDIMSLSFSNQLMQPNVSASNSSSFIGPHCNPECNAYSKVKRYDIGEHSSDGKNEWFTSNKCVSSVVCSSGSITPKPHSFKSISKLSFNVSRQLVSGCSMIGPVVNLPLAAPAPRGDSSQRTSTPKHIATWSLTMAVKALRLLWPAKGANDAKGKGSHCTPMHKKAQRWDTGTSSVVIPLARNNGMLEQDRA